MPPPRPSKRVNPTTRLLYCRWGAVTESARYSWGEVPVECQPEFTGRGVPEVDQPFGEERRPDVDHGACEVVQDAFDTPIDLTATTKTMNGDKARVFVEAKRVDNRELMTATKNQLIDRYLVPKNRRHGIYLVYWITPTQRADGWSRDTWPGVLLRSSYAPVLDRIEIARFSAPAR